MESKIAIIRIEAKNLHKVALDLARIKNMGIEPVEFMIPVVRLFRGKLKGEVHYEEKPLLLDYGFIRLPLNLLSDREKLIELPRLCEVLRGFFYRSRSDVTRNMQQYGEVYSLAKEDGIPSPELFDRPILVKLISEEEVDRLYKVASSRDQSHLTYNLTIGTHVVLNSYPFQGLSAEVVGKTTQGKVKLMLMDSGITITQDQEDLVYTCLDDPELH